MTSFNWHVTVEFDTRAARRVIGIARVMRFVVGRNLAERFAVWAAYRLTRWRIVGGRWRHLTVRP